MNTLNWNNGPTDWKYDNMRWALLMKPGEWVPILNETHQWVRLPLWLLERLDPTIEFRYFSLGLFKMNVYARAVLPEEGSCQCSDS